MATITSITSTNSVKDSRTTINTNFSNLNTDKVEANEVCMLEGTQSIDGVKTFTSLPETSTATPTTSVQIVAKGHLNTYAMPLAWKSTDGTFATNTNSLIPTEKAIKTYADTKVGVTNTQTISGLKYFSTKPTTTTASPILDEQIVTKKYVDDTSFSGTSNASDIVKGIVEIATQSETNSGSTTGATGAILAVRPDRLLAMTAIPSGVSSALSGKVATSGDETINGIKTFGSIPVLPASDPTTDNQAVRFAAVAQEVLAVSDTLQNSNDTLASTESVNYTKLKETVINEATLGAIRIKFTLKSSSSSYTVQGRIYKNGVALGTERQNNNTGGIEYSEDLGPFAAGDLIQIYGKRVGGDCSISNFRFCYTRTITKIRTIALATPLALAAYSCTNNS